MKSPFIFTLILFLSAPIIYSQETYLDNFGLVSYANNNGTQNWASNWVESNDGYNQANNGYVRITGGELRFNWIYTGDERIVRTADLSSALTANLSFDWRTVGLSGSQRLAIQISSNGGASYTTLDYLTGSTTGIYTTDITPYISSNTTIRFLSLDNNWGNNDYAFLDNVLISTTTTPPAPTLIVDNVSVNEDAGTANFTITHSDLDASGAFSADYIITAGSAAENIDYTTSTGLYTGTLNFNGTAGDTEQITVLITNDLEVEGDENYVISFTSVTDATVNITDTAIGTINAQVYSDQPLTLYEEFHGNVDYVVTGNTLRTQDNGTDSCAITNTTSNTLISSIPATATIRKAYLYWAHSSSTMDANVTFEGQSVTANVAYNAYSATYYSYLSDVTTIINGIADPSTNTYDFADLTIDNTTTCLIGGTLGGWSLIIFYDDASLPASSINLYQGFQRLRNDNTSFTLDSFYAISGAGAKATFLSWEGDDSLSGASESLSITNEGGTITTLSGDGGQTGNNAYNSTIYDDTQGPVYNDATTYGLDLDTYGISSYISSGDSQVTANVSVADDAVFFNAVLIRIQSNLVTGTVFEDLNYPGGDGRDMATASGVGIPNVTVELYNASNTLIETVTTDSNGDYNFGGMADGNYTVRVVNNSVRSTRGGGSSCTSCMPVQTYRNYNTSGSFVNVVNEVGGASSSSEDVGTGTLSGAQTISSLTMAGTGIVGLDFGFNFNTVVNTNGDGQGSLEQFIVNANNLDETGLDIEANSIFNPGAGEDTSIFMIPPTTDSQGRTADANYSSGIFDISIANGSPLSAITSANTKIDGRTQTAYSGDTNTGVIGLGGAAVGVSGTLLPNFNQPEIQIHRNSGDVLIVQASDMGLNNIAVYGGNNAGIRIDSGSAVIKSSLLGVNALGINEGNINYGIEVTGGTVVIDGNYIATNTDAGVMVNGGTSTVIQNNHITENGSAACNDNITLQNGTGIVIQQNLIANAAALGIDGNGIAGNVIILENTITTSGQDGGNCSGNIENAGIKLDGDNSSITNNIIATNGGAGIVLAGGNTSGNLISQNSIYANGTTSDALGIDLDTTDNLGDGVSINDNGDADNGPNGNINFPVISQLHVTGANFIVEGWVSSGATLEFFLTDISEGTAVLGDNELGLSRDYGEGQIYLNTFIEGSAADLDSRISFYSDVDGNTDNTNKFKFSIPLPSGVVPGNYITATATLANTTSEFSPFSNAKVYSVITNRKITYRVKKD